MTDTFLAIIAAELGFAVLLLVLIVGAEIWHYIQFRKLQMDKQNEPQMGVRLVEFPAGMPGMPQPEEKKEGEGEEEEGKKKSGQYL